MSTHLHSDDRHRGERKYKTGSTKRKEKAEKDASQQEELKKIRKIDTFYKPVDDTCTSLFNTPPHQSDHDTSAPPHQSDHDTNSCSNSTDEAICEIAHDDSAVSASSSVLNLSTVHHIATLSTLQTKSCNPESGFKNDIGLWPTSSTVDMRNYWVKNDFDALRNKNKLYKTSIRSVTEMMFRRLHKNGETIERHWLCFSPQKGKLYCFHCKLMNAGTGTFASCGYDDWKNGHRNIENHERTTMHADAVVKFNRLLSVNNRIDKQLAKQLEEKEKYWADVLKRVISVVCFLGKRGLPFRGENETVGSLQNGNFLGIMEVIADFDPFLSEHVQKHSNKGKGHTNYLSSTTFEELIDIIGVEVQDIIVSRIKSSKYFSLSVDGTPDSSNTDQLTVCLRYIENDGPVERFLTFMDSCGKTGEKIASAVLKFLNAVGLDIKDCRGQSHDNAASMSGKINGMQAWITRECGLATYVPCSAHSLNLVGEAAVQCCQAVVIFFDFVQRMYTYLSESTGRWLKLKLKLKEKQLPVPKMLSGTRWSAHADATKALLCGYDTMMDALECIVEDESESAVSKCTATGLLTIMSKLETGIFLNLWNTILERFNATSKTIQAENVQLNTVILLLKSLVSFVLSLRDKFDEFEKNGKVISGNEEYSNEKCRIRKGNTKYDSSVSEEVKLSSKECFRTKNFIPVLDCLIVQLDKRIVAYQDLNDKFGFLQNLLELNEEDLSRACAHLVDTYSTDLENSLVTELLQFRHIVKELLLNKKEELSLEHFMFKIMHERRLETTFPNTHILLRIYLSLMMTNCCGERSFSKLKYVKNCYRSTMTQQRLVNLALMSMEHDVVESVDLGKLIRTFSVKKARKVSFYTTSDI